MSFFCFHLSSCDEESLDTNLPVIKIDVNKIEKIPVHVDKTDGDWASFTFKNSLSLITPETKDYLDKIEMVEIKRLCYKIINFNGDPAGEVQGTFQLDKKISLENSFVVKTSADNQTVYYVTDVEELNRIGEALKNSRVINVVFSGSALCDDDAMDFEVEVSFEAKVKIDPIYTDY